MYIYKYGVCIYIYIHTHHINFLLWQPQDGLISPWFLLFPCNWRGQLGDHRIFENVGGGTWKSSLDPIFQPIGRLNHRISSRIWSTFWRVMMNTLAVRMKKRQPPGLCDNSQGYSQGGCGYQPGWSQCDSKLEIATKRVNTSFYHLVFFFALEFQSLGRRIFPEFEF